MDRLPRNAAIDEEAGRIGWPEMRADIKAMGSNITEAMGMTPRQLEQLTGARR